MEVIEVIDIEQLADAAKKRLIEHVNRSTGQHQRAVRNAFILLIKQTKERNHVTHG